MRKSKKRIDIDIQSLKFTPTHEWIYTYGNYVIIGVTEIVTNRLGSIVYLDLPMQGDEVLTIVPFGEIEAIDDTYDVNSPVEGEVVEVNEALMGKLDILSADPYKKGWLIKLRVEDVTPIGSLMSKKEYEDKFKIELNKGQRRTRKRLSLKRKSKKMMRTKI